MEIELPSTNVASSLQRWIDKRARKHGLKRVTTTTARAALTTRLCKEYEEGHLTETAFTTLLEHSPATSLRVYQRNSL